MVSTHKPASYFPAISSRAPSRNRVKKSGLSIPPTNSSPRTTRSSSTKQTQRPMGSRLTANYKKGFGDRQSDTWDFEESSKSQPSPTFTSNEPTFVIDTADRPAGCMGTISRAVGSIPNESKLTSRAWDTAHSVTETWKTGEKPSTVAGREQRGLQRALRTRSPQDQETRVAQSLVSYALTDVTDSRLRYVFLTKLEHR